MSRELHFEPPVGGIYLRDVLQRKSQQMRIIVERDTRAVLQARGDETAFVNKIVNGFRIALPKLDVDPEHIKKTEHYTQVHGTQLAGEVFPTDRMYNVWVVTFYIPYKGEIELIQYVPRGGAGFSLPGQISYNEDEEQVHFQTQTIDRPEKDIQAIRNQRDRVITFLQERPQALKPELEEYNNALEGSVRELFEAQKRKYNDDQGLLNQL